MQHHQTSERCFHTNIFPNSDLFPKSLQVYVKLANTFYSWGDIEFWDMPLEKPHLGKSRSWKTCSVLKRTKFGHTCALSRIIESSGLSVDECITLLPLRSSLNLSMSNLYFLDVSKAVKWWDTGFLQNKNYWMALVSFINRKYKASLIWYFYWQLVLADLSQIDFQILTGFDPEKDSKGFSEKHFYEKRKLFFLSQNSMMLSQTIFVQ